MPSDEGAHGSILDYLKQCNTSINPSRDLYYTLGSATRRWQNIYFNSASVGSLITTSSLIVTNNVAMGTNLVTGMAVNASGYVNVAGIANNTFKWGSGYAAPTSAAGVAFDSFFGAASNGVLAVPNSWALVNVGGSNYRIPLYT